MKLEFSVHSFEKYSNKKFHEISSSGGPSCSMRIGERTDTRKLIFAVRNIANSPKDA